jgi:hypothetical protein
VPAVLAMGLHHLLWQLHPVLAYRYPRRLGCGRRGPGPRGSGALAAS